MRTDSSTSTPSTSTPTTILLLFGLFLTAFHVLSLNTLQRQIGGSTTTTRNSIATITRTNATSTTRSGSKCIAFDDETIDNLIASSSMVFITGPAKAAMTSLRRFVSRCSHLSTSGKMDKRINGEEEYIPGHYLLVDHTISIDGKINVPDQLLSFHAHSDRVLIDLMENVPRDALIIYSYREETERLLSAIHHVLEVNCRKKDNITPILNNGTHCAYNETSVVKDVVEPRIYEIGRGAPEIMTCEFYDAIERNFPNMVFMNFKQADNLQMAIAKHQCPEFLEKEPLHKNMASTRTVNISLKLEKDGGMVTAEEWLQKKRAMLEWRLNLKGRGQQCQGKTRKMEDDLFECRDELLQVTRDTSF